MTDGLGEVEAVGGGAAAGDRAARSAQPSEPSLVSPSLRPKTSDHPVEVSVTEEVKRTRREAFEGQGTVVDGELIVPGEEILFEDGEWWLVVKDERYPVGTYEWAFLTGPDEEWCAAAVERARACWCSNSRRFLASASTGSVFALPCLSWSCEKCNRRKWHAARELFRRGIEDAWANEQQVRFLTLTVVRDDMTVQELSKAWDKLALLLRRGGPAPARPKKPKELKTKAQRAAWRKRYEQWKKKCSRRESYLDRYAAVIELGERTGRIHMHVLMTGRYIAHARLKLCVRRCGFGEVTHITLVRNNGGDSAAAMSAYAGKMASYAAKAGGVAEQLHARGAKRVRPVRSSHDWLENGLRGIEEELGIRKKQRGSDDPPPKDRGPWLMVEANQHGEARWSRTIGDKTVLPRASSS